MISFQLLAERCAKMTIECYSNYVKSSESRICNNPKYFWSFVKERRGGSSSYPVTLTDGIFTCSDGNSICNMFAPQFESVYNNNDCDLNPLLYPKTRHSNHAFSEALVSLYISSDLILKTLNSIDHTKGAGPDCIPPYFINKCAENLVTPLHFIFNTSLNAGVFPSVWKTAKVVPIHKAGDIHLVNNYRPISILSSLAKTFESLVCPFVQRHFEKYVCDEQNGFLRGRSVNTNMASYIEDIISCVDKKKQVDAIYTDFCKAFDKVVHKILLRKLNSYGVAGVFLD